MRHGAKITERELEQAARIAILFERRAAQRNTDSEKRRAALKKSDRIYIALERVSERTATPRDFHIILAAAREADRLDKKVAALC